MTRFAMRRTREFFRASENAGMVGADGDSGLSFRTAIPVGGSRGDGGRI